MPESYKRLGAIAPIDSEEYVLYSTPASTESLLSNITVTNRSSSSATFDINVYDESVGSQGSVLEDPLFVATQTGTSNQIALYSTNGITWTQTTMPVSALWHYISYGNGLFLATATEGDPNLVNSQIAAYSTDAITWTRTTLPIAADWRASIYAFNKWIVASGYSDNIVATSTDLITWTQGTMPISARIHNFALGNDLIVSAPGYFSIHDSGSNLGYSSSIIYSTDAITWNVSTVTSSSVYDISYGNNVFVLLDVRGISDRSTQNVFVSTDATSWTQYTMPLLASWMNISYGNEKFFAFTYNYPPASTGLSATSTDGITWTQATISNIIMSPNVIYANNRFVAVNKYTYDRNYESATSTDGVTWTQTTLPINGYWVGLTYAGQPYTSPSSNNLYKTSIIDGNETLVLEPGIALSPENSVVVKDNSSGNLTFSTYGVELS